MMNKTEGNLLFPGIILGFALGLIVIGGIVMVAKHHISVWPMIDNALSDEIAVEVGAIYSRKLSEFSDEITYIHVLAVKGGEYQFVFCDKNGAGRSGLKWESPIGEIREWKKVYVAAKGGPK